MPTCATAPQTRPASVKQTRLAIPPQEFETACWRVALLKPGKPSAVFASSITAPISQHVGSDLHKILADKLNLRRDLAGRPIAEKLRLLDSLHERELAIRGASTQTMRHEPESTIRFSAQLLRPEAPAGTGSWSVLSLPKTASAELPSLGVSVVEGTINGFPFRAALEPGAKGNYSLPVNRALQVAAGAAEGDVISVEITRVGEEPECRMPADLRDAMATAPSAAKLWTEITPLARRDWILWISSAKQPETRRNRIAKACSMLATGKRRPCCFGGLNWLVKDQPVAGQTWVDLPKPERTRRPRC